MVFRSYNALPYPGRPHRRAGLTFIDISDLKQTEVKLHETEQINSLLLNSTPNVIIALSADLKILEFNPEAEKFFGKKREDALGRNYIQMFVPEPARKKTEKDLDRLLSRAPGRKLKMQVISADVNIPEVEWSASVLQNKLNMSAVIILTLKK